MRDLPNSKVYEQEFKYFPWGILIKKILKVVNKTTPQNGSVLDLMCGPGYLLGEISKLRKDLVLEGVDINKEFIDHAKLNFPNILFKVEDVLLFTTTKKYDLILCTAGIHHLPYDKQELFIKKVSSFLKPTGSVIFADPLIDNFSNEQERRKAAAKLGYEYLVAIITNNAPDNLVKAAIDILYNDVMGFEYKTSLRKLEPILKSLFSSVKATKTWPKTNSEYGDYYFICKN